MVAKWGTTGDPEAATGNTGAVALPRLINGINTAASLYYGDTDPDDGSWGADELGRLWLDSSNEIDGSGDDLGPVLKRWSMLTAAPTYGWRTVNLRSIVEVSPNVNKLNLSGQSTTGFTDCDVTAETSALAVRVLIGVEVLDTGTPGASVNAEFRKNGVTTDAQEPVIYPQAASVPNYQTFWVELDNAQVFEYAINASGAGTFDLRVDILAYEERG